MATFKITLFFSSRRNGWSENYYWSGAGISPAAENAADKLITKRMKLAAPPTILDAVRINDDAIPRLSVLVPKDAEPTGTYVSKSDNPNVTGMMRLYTGDQHRTRALYLRGNPDNAFDLALPNNADSTEWYNRFAELGLFLKGEGTSNVGSWQVKYAPKPVMGANQFPITAWGAETPSTNSLINVPGIPNRLVNDILVIYKLKGLPFPPGKTLIVKVIDGPNGVYHVRYRTPPDFTYQGSGMAVLYVPNYDAINDVAANPRWTRRATGRPSDVSRGRRRSIAR